eukprot:6067591-Prymnesium_polylepis.1
MYAICFCTSGSSHWVSTSSMSSSRFRRTCATCARGVTPIGSDATRGGTPKGREGRGSVGGARAVA